AALHSPNTGIADFAGVARKLAEEVEEVTLGCEVTNAAERNGEVLVEHAHGETVARAVVFCAGGWSDRLAAANGAPADPRIVPFRGTYLRLRPDRRELV